MENLYKYFMNCPQLAITVLLFFSAGAISFIFQIVRNNKEFSIYSLYKHCIPFDVLRSKTFHMDVKMHFIHSFTDSFFKIPGLVVMGLVSQFAYGSILSLAPYYSAAPPSYLSAFACIMIILLAVEFSNYMVHYAEHKIPILWELHKVHHSADSMNPLTAKREHSLTLVYAGIVSGIIVGITAGILMFIFNISLIEAMALRAFSNKMATFWSLSPLKHSHIPVGLGWFDRIFISPHMHQVHHSKLEHHWDKNFGNNLSIFDWLFNTGYRPVKDEKIVFGISGYSDAELQQFNTLRGAFITPMLKIMDRFWAYVGPPKTATSNKSREGGGELVAVVDTGTKQVRLRRHKSIRPPFRRGNTASVVPVLEEPARVIVDR